MNASPPDPAPRAGRTILKGMDLPALEAWVEETLGEKRYRARQIFRWLYQRRAASFDEMTDLSATTRARLAEQAEVHALELESVYEASDGTRKIVTRVPRTGGTIETVYIPSDNRVTLCISSQVGCALGCEFCLTAKMGLHAHLTAGEIVDQVVWARRLFEHEQHISNIVFMGMGEPLHNYDNVVAAARLLLHDEGLNFSHRKVTISTVGLVPAIERLGQEDFTVGLAVSLNASNDEVRNQIMPVNRRWDIATLLETLRQFPMPKRRRITIEYVLLAGLNDSDDDALRLVKLLRGLPVKVNLIPWNPHEGSPFARPSRERVLAFQNVLIERHFNCLIRETRGDDKMAACGQLGGGPEGKVVGPKRRRAALEEAVG